MKHLGWAERIGLNGWIWGTVGVLALIALIVAFVHDAIA